MKRTIASVTAFLLLAATFTGCSAYNNPDKYVTLPELSSLTISQATIDQELADQLAEILDSNRKADYKEISEAAQKGDQVNIDYEGKPTDTGLTLDADTLAGMKAEASDLVLGSDSFIGAYTKDGKETHKGFEDQLIGKKAGDTVDVLVKFPDNYGTTALAGVEVNFTVTVNTVSRLTVDEDTLIEVGYEFLAPETETDKTETDKEEENESEGGSETEAEGEEATTTTESKDSNTPELDDGDEDDKESESKFSDLFKSGKFSIDYAEDADDTKFNDIFKVADYRDLFVGATLYQEFTKEVTIPTDVDEDYKDYAGKTITITFTVNSATVLPEWNDELAKEISGEVYNTTAEYEDALVKEIKIDQALVAAETAAVYDGYPKREAKELYKNYVDQLVESTAGDSLDNLTAAELKGLITDAEYEEIYASAAAQAMATVKSRLLVEYLCDELDVKLSSKEYKEELEKTFEDYQVDTSMMYYYYQYYGVIFTTAEEMETYFGKESLELQFKTSKMSEELVKVVQVVD